jgi:hypothetical protein
MKAMYTVAADLVVVLHFAFVLFAVSGALLVLKWRWCAWAHVPTVLWAALIEFAGWICPLTPLEVWLRERGGETGYRSGFVEHYIMPVLYPADLTRELQCVLGTGILLLNAGLYGWIVYRWIRGRRPTPSPAG